MTRFHASFFHFLISIAVGALLLVLCWFVWYPAPMLMAIGGHEIFLLVVGIDVVLGPLLTLVAFKSGKKSLKFDLGVIALLQMAALFYGVNTLLEARPVYIAALGNTFQVVQATEITDANILKSKVVLPWWGPRLVGTKAPTDRFEIDAVRDVSAGGGGRGHFPQLHISYESMSADILAEAQDISLLKKNNANKVDEIQSWLNDHDVNENSVKFQPIKIQASRFAVILDAKSAKFIGIIPFALVL